MEAVDTETASPSTMDTLRFLPFSSKFDLSFWHMFSEKKLNELKLSEAAVPFKAEYFMNSTVGHAIASVGFDAFEPNPSGQYLTLLGDLINKNSIDQFKECDKKELLKNSCANLIESIKSGEALADPTILNRMLLLSFADLKKYNFFHWSAFPSLSIPNSQFGTAPRQLDSVFDLDDLRTLSESFEGRQFMLLDRDSKAVVPFDEIKRRTDLLLVFADPSSDDAVVGWPLRNFLLLIAYHMPSASAEFDVIAVRGSKVHNFNKSRLLRVKLAKIDFEEAGIVYVGWERNEKGQYGPKLSKLASSMDPELLSNSAVELNLKLMRWRLAPDLNLERIADTKCLLLGSGTLGCNVARCLMGWGVRSITFVDNGRVSYSNPVRQSLFTFEDSLNGGKCKATAAAEALHRIFPSMDSKHETLTIPMPGHKIEESDEAPMRDVVARLEDLVRTHDVVFLLLDTREARWLPTLLGKLHNKIVINAALGFDTFLVMRHGTPVNELGCYFCNDVVGPTNSSKDRSLDQQCTVSRPGVSFMAASFATELLMALLHHPDGVNAKADSPSDDDDTENVLGFVPQQIRLFLSRYHFMTPMTNAFSKCTACSDTILEAYRNDGFNFIKRVLNDSQHLEDVSGLKELHALSREIEIIELEDTDNELSM